MIRLWSPFLGKNGKAPLIRCSLISPPVFLDSPSRSQLVKSFWVANSWTSYIEYKYIYIAVYSLYIYTCTCHSWSILKVISPVSLCLLDQCFGSLGPGRAEGCRVGEMASWSTGDVENWPRKPADIWLGPVFAEKKFWNPMCIHLSTSYIYIYALLQTASMKFQHIWVSKTWSRSAETALYIRNTNTDLQPQRRWPKCATGWTSTSTSNFQLVRCSGFWGMGPSSILNEFKSYKLIIMYFYSHPRPRLKRKWKIFSPASKHLGAGMVCSWVKDQIIFSNPYVSLIAFSFLRTPLWAYQSLFKSWGASASSTELGTFGATLTNQWRGHSRKNWQNSMLSNERFEIENPTFMLT